MTGVKGTSATQAKRKRKGIPREDIPLVFMALPLVLSLLIFNYIPMVGVVMAFQKLDISKGVFTSPFVGLKNFEFLFASTDAFRITRNTVLYNIAYITINMTLSITMALILSSIRSRRVSKLTQTIYMMPYFLSWSVVAIVTQAFLNRDYGLINMAIRGATGTKSLVDWYTRPNIWPYLLVIVNAWKGVGFSTVLYLAMISGISPDYYEAAMLDGASKWQQARYITIPHLRFIVSISLILAVGGIMRGDFGLHFTVPQIMQSTSSRLIPAVDIIDTYVYRSLVNLSNPGMPAAAGLYQSAVGLVLVIVANRIVSKIDPSSALF